MVTSVLSVGINYIDAGNFQVSVAYAESKNFAAKEAAMTDVELIETQAKEASRLRAIEAVKEKIAAYVRNFSGAKGKLNEDDIAAIAEKFEQVGETKYQKLFYNAVGEDGKELGKVGIMYEATVTAKFNSKKITEHIKLNAKEKEKRIRQAREAREKFEELDREYEELRKNARTKTPEQLQSEIKKFDDKIADLEKSRNKNKSAKKDKPKTKQDKIQPMKISSPVEVGKFGWNMRIGGIFIKDATYVSEQPKKTYDTLTYSNGVARFGKGDEALYLHYDMKSQPAFKIGSEDVKNTVPYSFVWSSILKLNANNGYTMYLVRKDYDIPEPYKQYVLIGRRPDGRWVKYFDIDELCNQYIGKNANVAIQKITFNGDTIIAQYARCNYPKDNNFYASKANEFGEFKFKWDEAAKWFSVEKITYNQNPTEQKTAQENKPTNNLPVNLSQPVKIGTIVASNIGGFAFRDGKIDNNGILSPYGRRNAYDTGIAKFTSDSDELYFHYKMGDWQKKIQGYMNFGDKKINNTVKVNLMFAHVFKIIGNDNLKFYLIQDSYDLREEAIYTLIGKNSQGKWVKYFDTGSVGISYFGTGGKNSTSSFGNSGIQWGLAFYNPEIKNNMIVIRYDRNKQRQPLGRNNADERGEFRFKWDDKAQWFSVEQVKY